MRLIPVRHGETLWNAEGREMGQLDSPLSPLGLEQAQRLARRLAALHIAAIYSSDLGRAMQTASIIAAECHAGIVPAPDLRERNMGIFQGLTRADMNARYPVEANAYLDNQDYAIAEGESGPERADRVIRAFSAIAKRHPHDTVVAVTHSGLLRAFFEWVVGVSSTQQARFRRDNATYNAIDCDAGRWMLVTWNDTSHLSQPVK